MQVQEIISVMKKKGYVVFEQDDKPFNLNIVGVRTDINKNKDAFDDSLFVFWKYKGTWNLLRFDFTTAASLYYLLNPINQLGTAILVPNQYRRALKIGLHKGKFRALVQHRPMQFYRDNNRDGNFDLNKATIVTELIGCNLHAAREGLRSLRIGKWSAACQVPADWHEHNLFMDICELAAKQFSDEFTYTLLLDTDFK